MFVIVTRCLDHYYYESLAYAFGLYQTAQLCFHYFNRSHFVSQSGDPLTRRDLLLDLETRYLMAPDALKGKANLDLSLFLFRS